jgi:hypothetical protein
VAGEAMALEAPRPCDHHGVGCPEAQLPRKGRIQGAQEPSAVPGTCVHCLVVTLLCLVDVPGPGPSLMWPKHHGDATTRECPPSPPPCLANRLKGLLQVPLADAAGLRSAGTVTVYPPGSLTQRAKGTCTRTRWAVARSPRQRGPARANEPGPNECVPLARPS